MDDLVNTDFSDVGLRKRTKLSPIRERSISPGSSPPKEVSWGSSDTPMLKMQNEIKTQFPEAFFTDEFCERENGTTTCLVGGITCDFNELAQFNKLPFDLRFEDGRLCLTHTSGSMPEVIVKKAKISKRTLGLIVLWIITIAILTGIILVFGEKYSELLEDYKI